MKPQYSFFLGRYQPLHKGHIAIIRKVMAEGKNILIGIKDTGINKDNPYTNEERIDMFFNEFGHSVDVMIVPDIMEVCHGRKTGWSVRNIRCDLEHISATKIREDKK